MDLNSERSIETIVRRFEKMLKTNEVLYFDSEDFIRIIEYYLDSGQQQKTIQAINIGSNQHPYSYDIKILGIEFYVGENKLNKAIALLEELEGVSEVAEDYHVQKAAILSKQNKHLEAIEELNKALACTSFPETMYYQMAMEYLFLDNFLMAKDFFIKSLNSDNQDVGALYNVIYCFESLDDHQGAIYFLGDFIDKNPYNEIAWHQLGKQYMALDKFEEAVAAFDFAIISDDSFVGAYIEMGKALEKLGQLNRAIEQYQSSLEIEDPTAFALLRIGACHQELGNDLLALKFYKKAVHEDPLFEKGWIAIVDYFMAQKAYVKALYYLKKALQIDNTNIVLWKKMAHCNNALSFFEEADLAYKELIDLGCHEYQIWLEWVETLRAMGETKRAIEVLHKALLSFPKSSEIQYLLSGLYYQSKQHLKGILYLKNAYKLNPKQFAHYSSAFPIMSESNFQLKSAKDTTSKLD